MFYLWILRKHLFSRTTLLDFHAILTVVGIALGVAVLIVAMAAFSGFETGLKTALVEVVGDVTVHKRGGKIRRPHKFEEQLGEMKKQITHQVRFLSQEVLLASKGKVAMALLQGVEKDGITKALNMKSRLVAGSLSWESDIPAAFVGKDVIENLGLKVGGVLKVILPQASTTSTTVFVPKVLRVRIQGVMDFGKYEYNSRFLFVDLPLVQDFVGTTAISGFRYQLKNSDLAPLWAEKLQEKVGWSYAVRDWRMINRNFLTAIEYEKWVIFFVVLIIIIAACFNVANTLFLSVLKRYREISLLKTLGASPFDIIVLFSLQGLVLGLIGVFLGIALGGSLCVGFEWLQTVYPILPSDVYKLSFVLTEIRLGDVSKIVCATLFICFLSTLIPAWRGSRLKPIEGLKYE